MLASQRGHFAISLGLTVLFSAVALLLAQGLTRQDRAIVLAVLAGSLVTSVGWAILPRLVGATWRPAAIALVTAGPALILAAYIVLVTSTSPG